MRWESTEITFCVRGVLSPLLSNIVLHALDCELERRGHRFVRYADDCNVYVRSARAGHRVMSSITLFITTRLKLKVNAAKSAVAAARERTFLGFSFTHGQRPKRRLAAKTLDRFKARVRELTRRVRGVSLQQMVQELAAYLRGWRAYFGFCETPTILRRLDKWIRRRLRAVVWKQWARPAEHAFSGVIIERNQRILDEAREAGPSLEHVPHRFAELAPRKTDLHRGPVPDAVEHRLRSILP
jgi:group II intron maturase/reverse transcriptase-like protein